MSDDKITTEFKRLCMRLIALDRGFRRNEIMDPDISTSAHLRVGALSIYWLPSEGLCATVNGPEGKYTLRTPIFNETLTPDIPIMADIPQMKAFIPVMQRMLILEDLADV